MSSMFGKSIVASGGNNNDTSSSDPKSTALTMWRAFAHGDEGASISAMNELRDLRGGSVFSFEAPSDLSASSLSGTYSEKIELPPGTPKATVDSWNVTKPTSLMRIVPGVHCLALVGDPSKEVVNTQDFLACGQHAFGMGVASDCGVGTHRDEKRKKRPILVPDGASYAIKVSTSSPATKCRVHSAPILREADLPVGLIDTGFVNHLEEWSVPAFVWKQLIEFYPGRDVMVTWMEEDGYHPAEHPIPRVDHHPAEHPTPRAGLPREYEEVVVEEASDDADVEPRGEDLEDLMVSAFAPRDVVSVTSSPSHHSERPAASHSAGNPYPWEGEFGNEVNSTLGTRSLPQVLDQNNDDHVEVLRQLETLRTDFIKFRERMLSELPTRDKSLAKNFRDMHRYVDEQILDIQHTIGKINLRSSTIDTSSIGMPRRLSWSDFDDDAKDDLAARIVEVMDVNEFAKAVIPPTNINVENDVADLHILVNTIESRLMKVEREFTGTEGAIPELRRTLDDWEKRRDSSSSTRGGYTFRDLSDVEALYAMVPPCEFYRYFLDIYSYLSLCTEAFTDYEHGVKVHADSIKANFKDVLSGRVRLSYETPYPPVVVTMVENSSTVSGGGTRWGPLFRTAEDFEDQFRVGSHRRVLQGVEGVFENMTATIDRVFPISGDIARPGTDLRKINMILQEHNRLGYQQTVSFIESFLPMYKTFKSGGLSSKDAWERVHVFAREFLSQFQKERSATADLSNGAALIWGSFKATDLGEEFRKAKFIEHPKTLSILALTSLEREGKSIAEAMDGIQSEKDSIIKLANRVKMAENQIKEIKSKIQ